MSHFTAVTILFIPKEYRHSAVDVNFGRSFGRSTRGSTYSRSMVVFVQPTAFSRTALRAFLLGRILSISLQLYDQSLASTNSALSASNQVEIFHPAQRRRSTLCQERPYD
jgi:hypothetical protein